MDNPQNSIIAHMPSCYAWISTILVIFIILQDTINFSECMREVMVSSYPSTLVDMVTLEVRQMLPHNEHAYW